MKGNTDIWALVTDQATGNILLREGRSARKSYMTRHFPRTRGRRRRSPKILTYRSRRFTNPFATARKTRMCSTKTERRKPASFESGEEISTLSRLQIINRNEDLSRRRYIERSPG